MIGKKVPVVAESLKPLRRLETCLRAAGNEVTLTCEYSAERDDVSVATE